MGYSTKEFCSFCNVGRETLRHYERLGFLKPKFDPENHYRSYDEWDASIIADIKRYQSIGFSLSEIRSLLSGHDLPQLTAAIKERILFYQEQEKYYRMLCQKSEKDLAVLERLPDLSGKCAPAKIPALVYYSEEELKTAASVSHHTSAIRHLDLLTPCLRIDHQYQGNESQGDFSGWGLMAEKIHADYYSIPSGTVIPASNVLCTIIDAGEKGTITASLFHRFIAQFQEQTSHVPQTIYAYLLARTHDADGEYHRYLYTFSQV